MRRIIFYLIILFFAVLIGLALKVDAGYVLIAYHHWTFEMPLWFAVIAGIIFFLLLHYFLRLFHAAKRTPLRWHAWRKTRRENKASLLINCGLLELVKGDWGKAETLLKQNAKYSSKPLVNYLGCALAAQHQAVDERMNYYLNKARQSDSKEKTAVDLYSAILQQHGGQFNASLKILQRLQKNAPKNQYILRLLKDLLVKQKAWNDLLNLLPKLKKYRVLKVGALAQLEEEIHQNLLASKQDKLKSLEKLWRDIPRQLKKSSKLLQGYCNNLLVFEQDEMAAKLIAESLSRQWDNNLVPIYGLAKTKSPGKQLAIAENWLKNQRNNPELLFALGQIAIRLTHWAKASEYLIASLNLQESPKTYAALGYVYEKTEDFQKALAIFKKGIHTIADFK